MKSQTRQSIFLAATPLLLASCSQSICETQPGLSACQLAIDITDKRISLSDEKPTELSPKAMFIRQVPLQLRVLDIRPETLEMDVGSALATASITDAGSIGLTFQRGAFKNKRGGMGTVAITIDNAVPLGVNGYARFFVRPKFSSAESYHFNYSANRSPDKLEFGQLIGEANRSIFVTETVQGATRSTREFIRYLPEKSTNKLIIDSSFNSSLRDFNDDTLITLNRSALDGKPAEDYALAYSQLPGTVMSAISIQASNMKLAPSTLMASTFIPMAMRGMDHSEKFFVIGKTGLAPAPEVKSVVFAKGSFQLISTAPLPITDGLRLASASPSHARTNDPDAAKAFDAVVLTKASQFLFIKHGVANTATALGEALSTAFQSIVPKDKLAAGIALADLDDDGLQDVLVAPGEGQPLYWAAQKANGTFEPPAILIEKLSGVRDIAVGDIDGDGLLDVAVATATGLTVYRNSAWQ
ncbi:MAG: VCBS repeat-containing protein [Myxococcales bacterium]|nr:VCBS repeat-containing protein [Myxococcales bacterium]